MVNGAPAPHFVLGFQGGDGFVAEARLEVHELASRVEAAAVHCRLWLETLVQDPCKSLDERGAEASTPGSPAGQDRAVVVKDDRRRHHAFHPCARLERVHEQVRLAEHAVQMDVEAR